MGRDATNPVTGDMRLSLTNDQKKRRRSLDTISHVFLSCQGDHDEPQEMTPRVAPLNGLPIPSDGTIAESGLDEHEVLPTISQSEGGAWHFTEHQAPRSGPIDQWTEGGKGVRSTGFMELVVRPDLYPMVKLVWRQATSQDRSFEATAPLPKEAWLNLARGCRERAAQIDAFASQELRSVWILLADSIKHEIHREERRERNRETYDSFGDFVAEISSRTDLDRMRKAQMIHDKAAELELH